MYVITANDDIEYVSDRRDAICILASLLLAGTTVTVTPLPLKEKPLDEETTASEASLN